MLISVVSVILAHFLFVSSSLFFFFNILWSRQVCIHEEHCVPYSHVTPHKHCPISVWHVYVYIWCRGWWWAKYYPATTSHLFSAPILLLSRDAWDPNPTRGPPYIMWWIGCIFLAHRPLPTPSLTWATTDAGIYIYVCMYVQWTHILIDQCAVVKLPLHWLP